jgi:AmmeMemoRadiSam system protein A
MSEEPARSPRPHPLVELARRAVEEFVRHGRVLAVPGPIPADFQAPAGAFVTLKKRGELRGCIGTLAPTCPDQFQEVVQNAISACCRDPRFPPVQAGELGHLQYQVYILRPAEPVGGLADLDPQRYGVIVHKSGRRGVLLPALEGIETAEVQVAIACRKAGIDPADDPDLERFEVLTFQEVPDEP